MKQENKMKRNSVRKAHSCIDCGRDYAQYCVVDGCGISNFKNWKPKKKATVEQVKKLVNHVRTWEPVLGKDYFITCIAMRLHSEGKGDEPNCQTCEMDDCLKGRQYTKPKKVTEKKDEGKIVYKCPMGKYYNERECKLDSHDCEFSGDKECNTKFKLIPVKEG
jgi:hypothetical protein